MIYDYLKYTILAGPTINEFPGFYPIHALLVTETYVPDAGTHRYVSNVSGEIFGGGGYTRAGPISSSLTGSVLQFDDVRFTSPTADDPAFAIVTYINIDDDDTASLLLGYQAFADPITLTGGDLVVHFTDGIALELDG